MNSQKKMMRNLFSSGISGTVSQVIVAAANLISLPILVASLGKSEYGIWVLIGFSLQFLAMSDLGMINSVGRLVAKYKTEDNSESLRKLVCTVAGLLVCVGIIIGCCTYIASFWISPILNISPDSQVIAQRVFLIGGLLLAVTIPLRLGNGILSGYQKYSTINYSQSILSMANLASIILLNATDQLGLVELILIYSVNILLMEFFRFYTSLKYLKFHLSLKYFSKRYMHEIIDLGSSSILTTLTAFGYRQGIVIATAHLLGVVEAGIFGICLVIINSISKLLSQLSIPIVTLVSEYSNSQALKSIRAMNNTFVSISFGLALCIFAGIVAYSEAILTHLFIDSDWTLNDYNTCYIALIIMAGSLVIGMPQMGGRSVLLGGGQHWFVARATFIASFCSIIGAIFSINSFGLIGAAIGWSIMWLLQGTILYPPMIKKRLEQSYLNMLKSAYLPGAYCGVIVSTYLWLTSNWINPENLSELIYSITFSVILGVSSLYISLKFINRY